MQNVPWHTWILERDRALRTCTFAASSNAFADKYSLLSRCTVLCSYYSHRSLHGLLLPFACARTYPDAPRFPCRTVEKCETVWKKILKTRDTFNIDRYLQNWSVIEQHGWVVKDFRPLPRTLLSFRALTQSLRQSGHPKPVVNYTAHLVSVTVM